MTNGIKANLDICRNCKYFKKTVVESCQNENIFFYSCWVPDANDHNIVNHAYGAKKKRIGTLIRSTLRTKHIPNACPFYLEHVVSSQKDIEMND